MSSAIPIAKMNPMWSTFLNSHHTTEMITNMTSNEAIVPTALPQSAEWAVYTGL